MPDTNPTEKAAQDATVRAESASQPNVHALRQLRERMGMNTTEFAASIGWSAGSLSQIETGCYPGRVGMRLLERLAKSFGLTLGQAKELADGRIPAGFNLPEPKEGAA